MKASKFKELLDRHIAEYGDLPIVGGFIHDDTPPTDICAIDVDGVAAEHWGPKDEGDAFKAVGFYIS